MYESFYGLASKPFQLNADPQFYFGSKQHQRAKAYLEYGLHQSEGFIVITGEVGAGKTTILRGLLDHLDPAQVIAANVVSTQLGADDILRMVCAAFGTEMKDTTKSGLLLALEAGLQAHRLAGRRCLLIIDEAQHLSYAALEELRMLSNFQSGTHALLQSFLVGQPEFRDIIFSPRMQQLRQRIIASCHIGPMDENETRGYVEHRLKCAGATDRPVFRQEAFQALFRASGGVPRRINLICDRLLLSGFLDDHYIFTDREVSEVAAEIISETSWAGTAADVYEPAASRTDGTELPSGGLRQEMTDSDGNVQTAPRPPVASNVAQRLSRLEGLVQRIEASHNATLKLLRNLTRPTAESGDTRKGKM